MLAFSGGGTRAAAFSFGLLEALRDITYETNSGPSRLLDDVRLISSVSGGSFTAAYYGLFGERIFTDFPSIFLHRNIEGALISRLFAPWNLIRLPFVGFDRIHVAAEYFDSEIFQSKTFGDLQAAGGLFILLNATDMGYATSFEFTQDQFDLICSDLSRFNIAAAVAASAAFPVYLSPLTLRNFSSEGCSFKPSPERIIAGSARGHYSRTNLRDTGDYVHLMDGGVSDNLGVYGVYGTLNGVSNELFPKDTDASRKTLLVILVNAKTNPTRKWDRDAAAPGVIDVLSFAGSLPLDYYSDKSSQLIGTLFRDAEADYHRKLRDYQARKTTSPNTADRPPPGLPKLEFIEVSFDRLYDNRLRDCMLNLSTSFYLPESTVLLIRQVAGLVLFNEMSFMRGRPWIRPRPSIDASLVNTVCGEPYSDKSIGPLLPEPAKAVPIPAAADDESS
jgi:predicted acylesterase/phospholipase RssA